jgi:two-component system OmpR family sensor kinase
MDGLKRRLSESVQIKLSFTLSLAILAVAIIAGLFSFHSAFDEAHELQDDVLRQVAQLVSRQSFQGALPAAAKPVDNGDEDTRVIVQRLGDATPSQLGPDGGGALTLPATLADGLHTLEVGGESFRVLVRTTATGERIAVSQESDFRNEIARDSALRTVLPFLILVPALLLMVSNIVCKMFEPIAALSREIDQRDEQELHSIEDSHLPVEVRPFALAINRLLGRVDKAMDVQRRFVADAAHELRSPLTALSLQAERLAEVEMSSLGRERLATLRLGIERGRSLLEQLLALAKAQSATESPSLPVSIQDIYRSVIEELMPLAEAKQIDIGVEGVHDAQVWVNHLDMFALVKNLVDNAIRYTPAGGRVDLAVRTADRYAVLSIQDNGPGIELAERNRVFAPFYRILGSGQTGSGLGLSIVQTIVTRIGARIHLEYADAARKIGLKVNVTIRLANSA